MKAIILTAPGPVDNLVMKDLPVPEIKPGEVLVKVKSIGINPVDFKTRKGGGVFTYGGVSKAVQLVLGWDISGVVTAAESPLFNIGDEVFGMVNFPGIGNAYAEYVAAPAAHIVLKPANLSHEEAAAGTLALLTAWQALVTNGNVSAGERVLIHAASGGVGHYAVQLAKQLGAYVIGTSSAANKDFVLSLGADEHIDYTAQQLADATENIDFVLESLSAQTVKESIAVMREGAKLISIVGSVSEDLKKEAASRNISANNMLVESNGEDMKAVAALLESGAIRSHVSSTFDFSEMAAVHNYLETGRTVGKVVVNMS